MRNNAFISRITKSVEKIFYLGLDFWDFLRELFWETIAFLTFEYDNYMIIKQCGREIGWYSLFAALFLLLTEDLNPEELEGERNLFVENILGEISEKTPELRENLEGVKTRVFKRKKNKIMNNLAELEDAVEELKKRTNYGVYRQKWKEALNSH